MQVPYTPVPSQTLDATPVPEMNPRVPAAAFGGGVGEAIGSLGKTVEGVGNELFARAIALQNLNNETEAKEADAKYMIGAGKLHAEYSALEGKAAVDAYPKYADDLQKLRQDTRKGLSTAMSQKLFDGSSLSTMGRSIFNGAGHAATEQKKYVVNTAVAQSKLDANTVSENPDDPKLFSDKLQQARHNAVTVSVAKGNPEGSVQEQLMIQQATSDLWFNRIKGKAFRDPYAANQMLTKHSGELTDDDRLKLEQTVRTQSRAVDSANIANEVYAGGKETADKPGKSLAEMEEEAVAKAKEHDPNDPILANHTRDAVRGLYSRQKYNEKTEDGDNMATINQALHDGVTDYQAFRSNPKLASAEDALVANGKKINMPAMINNYNDARDKKDNEYRFRQLMGNANNDVLGFLDYNAYADKHLSQGQMNAVVAKQNSLRKQVNQDPQVDRAMGWLRQLKSSEMQALGVYNRTKDNRDDYDHLTGTVQSALSVWADQHQHKQPTQKEFDEQIAPKVIEERAVPGWLWGTNKKPFYTQDIPEKYKADITADVIAKGGNEPTPEQLYRSYIRAQLAEFYKAKSKTESPK